MYRFSQNQAIGLCVSLLITLCTFTAHASEGASPKIGLGAPMYVDFKNIVVPVIKKNGSTGVIALTMMAQVKNESDKTEVVNNIPRLRDAFIRTLYGNLDSNKYVREDGALDIDYIKERLMRTASKVLQTKESPIQDILFQNIAQQAY